MSIRSLFNPLGSRLLQIRNNIKTVDAYSIFEITEITDSIELELESFSNNEIINICLEYEEKLNQIKAELNSKLTPALKKVPLPLKLKLLNPGENPYPEELLLLDECYHYAIFLERWKERKHEIENFEIKTVTEINLPNNFTIKDLNKGFEPILSPNQSALFLHYLRDLEIIPNYNQKSMGQICEILFARHNKTYSDCERNIHDLKNSKSELKDLETLLTKILTAVQSDMKKPKQA